MSDEEYPEWVRSVLAELERRGSVNTECVHERDAYRDAEQLVRDYYPTDE